MAFRVTRSPNQDNIRTSLLVAILLCAKMVHLLGALSLISCVCVAWVNGYVIGTPFFQPEYPPAYYPQPAPIGYAYGPWVNPWMTWKFSTFLPSTAQPPFLAPPPTPVAVSQLDEKTPEDLKPVGGPVYSAPLPTVQPVNPWAAPTPWAPWVAWKKANFVPPAGYQLPTAKPENSAENAVSSEEASPEGPLYRFPKAWYSKDVVPM